MDQYKALDKTFRLIHHFGGGQAFLALAERRLVLFDESSVLGVDFREVPAPRGHLGGGGESIQSALKKLDACFDLE